MGVPSSQEATREDSEKIQEFFKKYTPETGYIPQIPDSNLYKPSHLQEVKPHDLIVLTKRYVFRSKEETPRFVEMMRVRKTMPSSYLPRLLDYFMKIDNGYCQTFYTYHVNFEYSKFNLEKELLSRINSSQPIYFAESEVWYMLFSIVRALDELRAAGINHGDVQPFFVMLDSQGNIRLVDFMCYQGNKNSGLMRMLQTNTHYSPIAPELLPVLKARIPNNNYSMEKADVFSLGITMLALCAVTDYRSTFYDFGNQELRQDKIADTLSSIATQGRYSPVLMDALKNMLHPEPAKRSSIQSLLKYVTERVEL